METSTVCSYCGRLNGGHSMACQALEKSDPDELRKLGWERHQLLDIPDFLRNQDNLKAERASKDGEG